MPKQIRGAILVALTTLTASALRADPIDDLVRRRMEQLRLPGASVAIVRNGELVTQRSYGSADLEHNVPVTAETVFELGSVTKQFTAVAVMLLVEDGKLRLDDSIARHLPDVPEAWKLITVRHLLTHSGGIQEYLSVAGLPAQAHALSHEAMTRLFFERLELEFAPGATWSYSNSGYLLLGDIIERVSGRSYWEFLRARIFEPLAMRATRSSNPASVIPHRAAGYGWAEGAFENRSALSENAYSAGAIVSTIGDMARWEAAMQRRALLRSESFDELWTALTTTTGPMPPFAYAFGWVVDEERGHRAVLHSGGTPGFSSAVRRYVDDRVSAIVFANHGDRLLDHVARELAEFALPSAARARTAVDPDPDRSRMLLTTFRELLAGKANRGAFTPAMQLFLNTATGRGLWEWIASHGPLGSLTYVQTEASDSASVLRYRASVGGAELSFSFTVMPDGRIARVYWW